MLRLEIELDKINALGLVLDISFTFDEAQVIKYKKIIPIEVLTLKSFIDIYLDKAKEDIKKELVKMYG